jgi:DNA-directed RNA polymerase subunit beta'
LKTADAGYLTRRLVDVAQDVIIEEDDCGTLNGVWVEPLMDGTDIIAGLDERIVGRYPLDDVTVPGESEPIVKRTKKSPKKAKKIVKWACRPSRIRSVLTCQSKRGVCASVLRPQSGHRPLVENGRSGRHHRRAVHRRTRHAA